MPEDSKADAVENLLSEEKAIEGRKQATTGDAAAKPKAKG
jgi:hypothetical protein